MIHKFNKPIDSVATLKEAQAYYALQNQVYQQKLVKTTHQLNPMNHKKTEGQKLVSFFSQPLIRNAIALVAGIFAKGGAGKKFVGNNFPKSSVGLGIVAAKVTVPLVLKYIRARRHKAA